MNLDRLQKVLKETGIWTGMDVTGLILFTCYIIGLIGQIMNISCPSVAATTDTRLARCWPCTSLRSNSSRHGFASSACAKGELFFLTRLGMHLFLTNYLLQAPWFTWHVMLHRHY